MNRENRPRTSLRRFVTLPGFAMLALSAQAQVPSAPGAVAGSAATAPMSLGGGASSAMDAAIAQATAKGIPVVVAAGNESRNACLGSPARAPSALTVGATDSQDRRASFSNFGSCLDLFAPGVSIRSASNTSPTGSRFLSGTSMASPHVAGLAAPVLQTQPSAPADSPDRLGA